MGDTKNSMARKKELVKKHRIVDLLLTESKSLKGKLSRQDQVVLERHMETLRDLEVYGKDEKTYKNGALYDRFLSQ